MRYSIEQLIRPLLIWFALFSGITIFLFWNNMTGAARVMRNHRVVEGTITELLPKEHRTVVVSYVVDGTEYETRTSLPDDLGLRPFEQLRIGDKVRVEYNPARPGYGIPGNAERVFASDLKGIGFIAVFLVFATAYFEFNIRRRVRKSHRKIDARNDQIA